MEHESGMTAEREENRGNNEVRERFDAAVLARNAAQEKLARTLEEKGAVSPAYREALAEYEEAFGRYQEASHTFGEHLLSVGGGNHHESFSPGKKEGN